MNLLLHRQVLDPGFTLGSLFTDDEFVGYTCEDTDRGLENGGDKIYGETAIPRGRYRVVLSRSQRFKKVMPEVLDVPGFSGIRIHGGNNATHTLGCILLGAERVTGGVRNCTDINAHLIDLIAEANRKGQTWLTVE